MGMERCGKFMKWSLFGFNFLILIAGGVLLGIGIYTRVNQSGLAQISAILRNELYSTFSLALIIVGCLIIVISFFGCCGAIKEVRCMLGAFFVLLVVIFTALLIGGIVAYAFRNDLSSFARRQMTVSIHEAYGMEDKQPVTDAWNSIQQLFKCCGVEGDVHSNSSWASYKLHSKWYHETLTKKPKSKVPISCCTDLQDGDKIKICVGQNHDTSMVPNLGPPKFKKQRRNPYLYTDGCFTAIVDFIKANAIIIGSVAVAIAVVMILGMVFSLCLCRAIREEYELGETNYYPPVVPK